VNTLDPPTPDPADGGWQSGSMIGGPVPHGADRWAQPGETCTCGLPAKVIYTTPGYGDVGWCGRSNS
jgi:hypothetical protein